MPAGGESHVSWPGLGSIAIGWALGYGSRVHRRECNRLRNLPRYTDFRLLERDLRAAAAAADKTNAAAPRMLVALSGGASVVYVCRLQRRFPFPSHLLRSPRPRSPLSRPRRSRAWTSRAERHPLVSLALVPLGTLPAGAATADELVTCLHSTQSDGTPRRCVYYDAVTEHYLARQTARSGEWIRDSVVVGGITAESPEWRLEDGAGGSVNMHRASAFGEFSEASRAGHWTLQPAFDKFEPVGGQSSLINNLLDMNMGINVLGMRHRERIIPQDTVLTAVGEAMLVPRGPDARGRGGVRATEVGGAGNASVIGAGSGDARSAEGAAGGAGGVAAAADGFEVRLRRPRKEDGSYGHRIFTVTQQPFDEYVNSFATVAKVFNAGCAVFVGIGASMMLVKLARVRMVRWREKRFRRRLAEAEKARREAAAVAAGAESPSEGSVVGRTANAADVTQGASVGVNEEDVSHSRRPGETCVVCLYEEACVCYKDCGHLVCCEGCAGRMTRCPLCRRKSSWMRVYRAGL